MTQFALKDDFVKFNPLETEFFSKKSGLIFVLGLFTFLFILDQMVELRLGATYSELFIDLLLELPRVVLFTGILLIASFHINKRGRKINHLAKQLQKAQSQSDQQQIIEMEAVKWALTKSEVQILTLILRGKNSKEMARKRFTSERTVRNHCQSIYEKSGLKGKHEIMAHFLNHQLK